MVYILESGSAVSESEAKNKTMSEYKQGEIRAYFADQLRQKTV